MRYLTLRIYAGRGVRGGEEGIGIGFVDKECSEQPKTRFTSNRKILFDNFHPRGSGPFPILLQLIHRQSQVIDSQSRQRVELSNEILGNDFGPRVQFFTRV